MSDRESPVGSPVANGADHLESEEAEVAEQGGSGNDEPREGAGGATATELSEHDSDDALSEIDENQFEDYDPATADIEDRPIAIDDDVAKTLKASRRKRAEGEPKRPKEGRREKKRQRDDEEGADGDFSDGKAPMRKSRRAATDGRQRAAKATPEPENEDHLSPEERRQRAIERALDAALKKPKAKRRRQDEEDLESAIDDQIADLKIAMERACQHDINAREEGRPATWKLQLLPRVVALLNRQDVQHTVLDPDTNFLQHVRFFLEPLSDGSLPAYNIQRDIFTALTTLPIEKEQLLSSAIGKVVLFYTQSKQPELQIKRMAERLLGEWSRPLLKRTDDYRKRQIQTREFDYDALKATQRQGSQITLTQRPSAQSARQAERDRFLAQKTSNNRARPGGLPDSYTIAPVSTFDPSSAPDHRPIGASGAEAFRRMKANAKKR